MQRTTRLFAAAAAIALAGSVTACTSADDAPGTDAKASAGASAAAAIPSYDVSKIQKQDDIIAMLPDSIKADGKLIVGAATDYAPAEFRDAKGNPVGYDIDLTKALAKVLDLTPETQHAEFDSIIPAVGSKYDLGISSFTITAEREQSTEMVSYITVGSQFNVPKGNPDGLDVSDTLNLCGKSVGVQTGTAQEDAIKEYDTKCKDAGKEAIDIKSYAAQTDATTALAGATIDATFSDSTVAGYAEKLTNGAVETTGPIFDAAPQGIVIAKGDEQTAKAIQAAVQYLMDQGVWNDILTTWGVSTDQALTKAEINPAV